MFHSSTSSRDQLAASATPMKIGHQSPSVKYVERTAVRAVLLNPFTNEIAIIHVNKGDYYKLPGGGIEPDENHSIALARELLEETGCKARTDISTCFAKCEEFRDDLHQMSYCYVAVMFEDTGRRALTDIETAEGLTHSWVSAEEAIKLMKEAKPTSELGKYVTQRDLFFVEKFTGLKKN